MTHFELVCLVLAALVAGKVGVRSLVARQASGKIDNPSPTEEVEAAPEASSLLTRVAEWVWEKRGGGELDLDDEDGEDPDDSEDDAQDLTRTPTQGLTGDEQYALRVAARLADGTMEHAAAVRDLMTKTGLASGQAQRLLRQAQQRIGMEG